MALDAALLALTAGELKNTLLDAKIDKIFEPTRDEVLLTLRTRTDTLIPTKCVTRFPTQFLTKSSLRIKTLMLPVRLQLQQA